MGEFGDHSDEGRGSGDAPTGVDQTSPDSEGSRPWKAEAGSRISQVDLSLLQRLYESLGPARSGSKLTGANLIRSVSPADLRLAASGPQVFEYDAGPFTVILEIAADADGTAVIQGHVLHAEDGGFADARIIMDPGRGVVRVGLVTSEGEFRIDGLGPAVYQMVILTDRGRVVLERLTIR